MSISDDHHREQINKLWEDKASKESVESIRSMAHRRLSNLEGDIKWAIRATILTLFAALGQALAIILLLWPGGG